MQDKMFHGFQMERSEFVTDLEGVLSFFLNLIEAVCASLDICFKDNDII